MMLNGGSKTCVGTGMRFPCWPSFRDAPLGAGPESILPIVVMDSGLALRAPRNDAVMGSELSPRPSEDTLGDDAEHHLAGTAFDRIGLGAQPGARTGAAF